jgi:hypothetical protein
VTIAINLKVNDGVVLAADSATTLITRDPQGRPVVTNVYNNANKIFNLRKGSPIGLITWGSGSIGLASIATLAKDLRSRFTDRTDGFEDWQLNPENYELLEVARNVQRFFYEEHYQEAFAAWPEKPMLGFVVAGYSKPSRAPEEYTIQMDNRGNCVGPVAVRQPEQVGATWNGMQDPLTRLILGFAPNLLPLLQEAMPEHRAELAAAFAKVRPQLGVPFVQAAMPLQDAIDLAKYLADLAISFSKFAPGAAVVGGPVEIAAITKHEGFKWVLRKYYFDRSYNPTEEDDNV